MDTTPTTAPPPEDVKPRRRRRWLRWLGLAALVMVLLLVCLRLALPSIVVRYVNQTLDRNPQFDGSIGGVEISLHRGAYTIRDVKLIKTTGSVPVPLFACDRLDLSLEWGALLHGSVVGKVRMDGPEVNFVDAPPDKGKEPEADDAGDQTGGGGAWLAMLQDLFPFDLNRVDIVDGSVHFRTYQGDVPVDVYLGEMQATVDDLTNVQNRTTPLVTTVQAKAKAMGQADFELNVKIDPFSYRPTFHLTARLLNLDVTKINALTRTYGSFDFEHGWFDLVVDLDAKEGSIYGYVKPLFRNLKIITMQDVREDNALQVFWEALVGGAEFLLKNHPREQFGTVIPFRGDVDNPETGILDTIGNVLRNAFIRAYLPRLETAGKIEDPSLLFEPALPFDAPPPTRPGR
jgi:hypothetical protein